MALQLFKHQLFTIICSKSLIASIFSSIAIFSWLESADFESSHSFISNRLFLG